MNSSHALSWNSCASSCYLICKRLILLFILHYSFVNGSCGCRNSNSREPRIFGSTIKNGVCFGSSFLSIIHDAISDDMVLIKGGKHSIGTNNPIIHTDGEGPKREVELTDFYMDKFEVSNQKFDRFVAITGYITDAEKYGNSFVLYSLVEDVDANENISAVAAAPWWLSIPNANWRHPEGPNSSVSGRWNHPVVHVSWFDAVSYCNWIGKRLPTEAEWEVSCNGGLKDNLFSWGNKLVINGTYKANTWQGLFPLKNTGDDGFESTAPVDQFLQNKYGLYNMIGNVWEWTNDWWDVRHVKMYADPTGPLTGTDKVKKGGSYMCHKDYCFRYRCAARSQNTPDTTAANIGFRCARTKISELIAMCCTFYSPCLLPLSILAEENL